MAKIMAVYGNKTYKGTWKPRHPEKYVGDASNITYRSSWEVKFMNYCDSRDDIVEWSSEEVVLPYFDPVQNKMRRYFVDFWMKVKQPDGSTKKFLVEIKPDKFTRPPAPPKRKTRQFVEEALQYATNNAKWEAATKICEENDMEFVILTENHLYKNGNTR